MPKAQIGGCGSTAADWEFGGFCKCQPDGSFKASLSITLSGIISIANDIWVTPKRAILWHERRHWRYKVEEIMQAKQAGEAVEAQRFPSRKACLDQVEAWKAESEANMGKRGKHTIVDSFFWGLTCM